MSRLMKDLSPGTYVVNPDTLAHPSQKLCIRMASVSLGALVAAPAALARHQRGSICRRAAAWAAVSLV